MVEGGMKCVKYLLFAFNLIFFLAGLGLIIAGAVVHTKFSMYFAFINGSFNAASILLIVVGVIIFIIGFFGCCGAYKENYCMTMTFAVLLGLIFILEIAAGITAYVLRDQVQDQLEKSMLDTMKNLTMTDEKDARVRTWNIVQSDFDCCGVNNYTDWTNRGMAIPDSCCIKESQGCASDLTKIEKKGCFPSILSSVKSNIMIIAGVGIALAFVQVFGIAMACCLGRSIKKEYEVV